MAAGGVQLLQQWIKQRWTSDAAGESAGEPAGSRCGPFISAGCWNDGGSRRPGRLKESTDAVWPTAGGITHYNTDTFTLV